MAKWAQGFYEIKNPNKYIGNKKPRYRSSWELTFMSFADNNSSILQWASECIQIPYRNPLTGKNTIYVPDFLIVYQNKTGKVITELIEIKPKKQTIMEEKNRPKDRAVIAVNHHKWAAAAMWCKRNQITFRVITEEQIFFNGRK